MTDTPMTDPNDAADEMDDHERGLTDDPDEMPPGALEEIDDEDEMPEDAGDPAI